MKFFFDVFWYVVENKKLFNKSFEIFQKFCFVLELFQFKEIQIPFMTSASQVNGAIRWFEKMLT